MKQILISSILILITLSCVAQYDSAKLHAEKIKVERNKSIRRATKATIGIVLFTVFEVPAIPVVAAFAISEILSDTKNTSNNEK